MKDIKISNNYKLHVYLIKETNIDDPMDEFYECHSEEIEEEQTGIYRDKYKESADLFLQVMGKYYTPAFQIELVDRMIISLVEDWMINFKNKEDLKEYQHILDYYSKIK